MRVEKDRRLESLATEFHPVENNSIAQARLRPVKYWTARREVVPGQMTVQEAQRNASFDPL